MEGALKYFVRDAADQDRPRVPVRILGDDGNAYCVSSDEGRARRDVRFRAGG